MKHAFAFAMLLSCLGIGCFATSQKGGSAVNGPATDSTSRVTPEELAEDAGWGEPANGLRLKIGTANGRYRVGEDILVVFTFDNVSDKPFRVVNTDVSPSWLHQFEFQTTDGRRIAYTAPVDPNWGKWKLIQDELAPGRQMGHEVRLNPWKLAGLGHPYTEIGAEPRTIVVTGIYRTPVGLDLFDQGVWYGQVQSKALRIEIVE